MERIVWSDKFSVGHEEIDRQHRRLIGMINRLIEAGGTTTRSETIADLLTEMTMYGQEHLRYEEQLLEEIVYPGPDLAKHRECHRAYRKKVVDFCTATTLGVGSVPDALLNYLREWWVNHILHEDAKYAPFLRERQNV